MDSEKLSPAKAESPDASTTAVVPVDSERLSPAREASQDQLSQDSWDSNYWDPKWGKDPPKVWRPYLEKFTLFPKLPIEIRQAIWKTTLKPRAVEIEHGVDRGFYSRVHVPVALRVNKDSRNAVGLLYPLCFGSVLHQPRIVFNFSLDTLYFDGAEWTDVPLFLTGLKDIELRQIRSIAVDRDIDEVREWDDMGYNPYNNMDCFKTATAAMPSLKEFRVVCKVDESWHDHGFSQGSGPIELFEEFPYEVQQELFLDDYHIDDEDGQSECQELPNSEHMLEGFNVPMTGSIWGWRRTVTQKV